LILIEKIILERGTLWTYCIGDQTVLMVLMAASRTLTTKLFESLFWPIKISTGHQVNASKAVVPDFQAAFGRYRVAERASELCLSRIP
jgi:hypothetical protein